MSKKPSTRQLILEAAVACIERYGIEKVTTRKIAIAAGKNIAAINYHFRSKDELIAETMLMTINHMLDDVFAAIEMPEVAFESTLTDVLFYLLDGSLRFPGISRAHLHIAIADKNRESVSARAMARVFDRLSTRAAEAFPHKNPGELRLRLAQVMASALLIMLTPQFFRLPTEYKLMSSKRAREWAKSYAGLWVSGI